MSGLQFSLAPSGLNARHTVEEVFIISSAGKSKLVREIVEKKVISFIKP
jgi:hypothetical protein